ncbi:MAG: SAM-dependent methyltransferase, partial [Hymenobacteraceae bacterium]|nr:SAM-dependent methyltransferase [Hymenobacteraceae bacterium]
MAPFYDVLAGGVFGGALRRAQVWTISQGLPGEARRILFIGGGTGAVLPAVLAHAPAAHVLYVEASVAMLARARVHLARTARPEDLARVECRPGPEASVRVDERS